MSMLASELTERLVVDSWIPDLASDNMGYLRKVDGLYWQFDVNAVVEDGVACLPILGVRHPLTSQLYAEFCGRTPLPETASGVCQVGCALADLVTPPGFSRWEVREEGDVERVASVLYGDLMSIGMPFFENHRTATKVLESLIGNQSRHHALNAHLAILSSLVGRQDVAIAALRSYVESARGQRGKAASQSWLFIESYVTYFGLGGEFLPLRNG